MKSCLDLDEQRARIAWNLTLGVGPILLQKLLVRYGRLKEALSQPLEGWPDTEGVSRASIERVQRIRDSSEPEKVLEEARRAGAWIWFYEDYPALLQAIPDPPVLLYGFGEWKKEEDALAVALVGTRKLSPYGEAMASRLSRDLVQAGVRTVSGLARGIDTVVHRETLAAGGRTLAVLGSGLLRCYPPENRNLLKSVAEAGAVVSEFPLSSGPAPENFPKRNRLISGFSLGTVVVEAPLPSGALITAAQALEQGRDVFAVPGPVHAPNSKGVHRLLRDGAKLVESAEDILEELKPIREPWQQTALEGFPPPGLDPEEQKVLSCVGAEPVGLDALAQGSALSASQLSRYLVKLEMKGYVRAMPGRQYVKKIF